jgi:hypothetical protein
MKNRIVAFTLTFALVLCVLLVFVLKPVSANPGSILAGGTWHYSKEVTGDEIILKYANVKWLQLITHGIKIDQPTYLCHDFKGATLGWEGEIRRLSRGKWIAVESILIPPVGDEMFQVCVNAPVAGTYALFGYYNASGEASQTSEVFATISGNSTEGHWNTGTEFDIDLKAMPAETWLRFFSRGVEIESPTLICYPFRNGLYGWAAEIRMWNSDTYQWVKLKTIAGFVNEDEGSPYQACAQTYIAGKYALFGYLGDQPE